MTRFLVDLNFRDVFCTLTDMVARCTLNIKIDNPRDPTNPFLKGFSEVLAVTGLQARFQRKDREFFHLFREIS